MPQTQTQKQVNNQNQNVKVIVNAPAPPKRRRRRTPQAPPPPQAVPTLPMAMSGLGIQPTAPRPVTYAPSSQMIIQDNAPPPPAWFEKAQTNVESTIAQLRQHFQSEVDDFKNELLAQQAHTNQLKDIEQVAKAVQTSFDSMLPRQSTASSSSVEPMSISVPPPPPPPSSHGNHGPSPMSYSVQNNPIFEPDSDDTVQGAYNPYSPSHHSTESENSHDPTMPSTSTFSNDPSSSSRPSTIEQMQREHQRQVAAAAVGLSSATVNQPAPNVAQVAAIPLPSSTVNQPWMPNIAPQYPPHPIIIPSSSGSTVNQPNQQQQRVPPISLSSSDITTPVGSTASGSRSNESRPLGGLANETPHEHAYRLYREHRARRRQNRNRYANALRNLARSMGVQAGDTERIDHIMRRLGFTEGDLL
jgi:hypothetical protein